MLFAREKLDTSCGGWGEELGEGAVLRCSLPWAATGLSQLPRVFFVMPSLNRESLSATWGHSYLLIFKGSSASYGMLSPRVVCSLPDAITNLFCHQLRCSHMAEGTGPEIQSPKWTPWCVESGNQVQTFLLYIDVDQCIFFSLKKARNLGWTGGGGQ